MVILMCGLLIVLRLNLRGWECFRGCRSDRLLVLLRVLIHLLALLELELGFGGCMDIYCWGMYSSV